MQYTGGYESPLGGILLAADQVGLTGLWFEGQKRFAQGLDAQSQQREVPTIAAARLWLDQYFAGREPSVQVPVHLMGTPFQQQVWEILQGIPRGHVVTYGQIARQIAESCGLVSMSSQAVGGAVGRNPVSIIVPCHRVVGANGSLTGYAGGLSRKVALLELEGVWRDGHLACADDLARKA